MTSIIASCRNDQKRPAPLWEYAVLLMLVAVGCKKDPQPEPDDPTTETVTFDIIKNKKIYTAKIEIDRSKYDVRYGSTSFIDSLGDKAIDDIFILNIKLLIN